VTEVTPSLVKFLGFARDCLQCSTSLLLSSSLNPSQRARHRYSAATANREKSAGTLNPSQGPGTRRVQRQSLLWQSHFVPLNPFSKPTTSKGYRLWVGGPVPPGSDAITIGRTIITRKRVSASPTFENLLRHELTHVEQWRRLGHVTFLRRYIGEYVSGRRKGLTHNQAYLDISFEREARARAFDHATAPIVSIADVEAAHRASLAALDGLDDDALLLPSKLPDWTAGHVIAHLIGNVEALTRVIAGANPTQPVSMYDNPEHRTSYIETLRGKHASELIEQLGTANEQFEQAWHGADPHTIESAVASGFPGGPLFPVTEVLVRRLRETEVHTADVGTRRYTYESWSNAFVDAELATQWPTVGKRLRDPVHLVDELGVHHTTPGGVRLPATYGTRRSIVAWLLSRHQPPTFPDIGSWQ
jgi:uncharacterized protein (TIGR03083 family)